MFEQGHSVEEVADALHKQLARGGFTEPPATPQAALHSTRSPDDPIRFYLDFERRLWVAHDDLLRCGYRDIDNLDIIQANGKFYELQGYLEPGKSWWVEEVNAPRTLKAANKTHPVGRTEPPWIKESARDRVDRYVLTFIILAIAVGLPILAFRWGGDAWSNDSPPAGCLDGINC